jgi:hypothetical protein
LLPKKLRQKTWLSGLPVECYLLICFNKGRKE